jgi:prepilin-type N-terminal cleavage/methylation domain-containing protein
VRGAGPSTQAGFTLLETLVALTIVSIGFAGAFGAMPESLGAQDRARNLEAATAVAEAADGRFAWHAEALPIPGAPQPQPGAFAGQVLRVTVRWPEGRNTRTITLQTVRLGLLPPG